MSLSRLLAAVVAAALAACGGSALDDERPLIELDTTELASLCHDYAGVTSGLGDADRLRWSCYVNAIVLHEAAPILVPSCEVAASECIADAAPVSPGEDCDVEASDVPACGAHVTVGEFESCVADIADAIRASLARLSCDLDVDAVLLPPTCAAIEDRCPGLLGK